MLAMFCCCSAAESGRLPRLIERGDLKGILLAVKDGEGTARRVEILRIERLRRGVASQCIGGGEATAICIEIAD